ncbi:MAG: hypothetical protein HN688_07400, partial [Proteobacteria bacterium]|nr:hypothetical protein [Pseudomonadota bacterium]
MQKSHIFHPRPVAYEDLIGHNILIHIPRTAGTFFNNCLRANGLAVVDHIQRFIDSSESIKHTPTRRQLSNRSTWISGHVRYDTLTRIFPPEKDTRYFVLLRNPINQLISQINWQAETLCGSYLSLARMPLYQFRILMHVCLEALNRPQNVPNVLNRYFGSFLNNQCRSLSLMNSGRLRTDDFNLFSARCYARLLELDGFSVESGLDPFIKAVISENRGNNHTQIIPPRSAQNRSHPVLDNGLVSSEEFRLKIFNLQLADYILYQNALGILNGEQSPRRWQNFNELKHDCEGLAVGQKSPEVVRNEKFVLKTQSRTEKLFFTARVMRSVAKRLVALQKFSLFQQVFRW